VITNALPPGIEALCDRLARRARGAVGRKVISVVRLSPEKNVEALIEAAAVEGARFEVVIYGRGPHEAALRARAEALGVMGRGGPHHLCRAIAARRCWPAWRNAMCLRR
jgi:glycosyltransferase involved in cell wall biosynthesis